MATRAQSCNLASTSGVLLDVVTYTSAPCSAVALAHVARRRVRVHIAPAGSGPRHGTARQSLAPAAGGGADSGRRETICCPRHLPRSSISWPIFARSRGRNRKPEAAAADLRALNAHNTEEVSRRRLECLGVPRRNPELGNFGQLSARPVVKRGVERWQLLDRIRQHRRCVASRRRIRGGVVCADFVVLLP